MVPFEKLLSFMTLVCMGVRETQTDLYVVARDLRRWRTAQEAFSAVMMLTLS